MRCLKELEILLIQATGTSTSFQRLTNHWEWQAAFQMWLTRSIMKTPHLNVRVRTLPGKSNSTATNNSFLNTNPYTFGLGILLLEHAYQTPFNDLRLLDSSNSLSLPSSPPSSLPPSRTSSLTVSSATYACTNPIDDFSLADRLSRSLSSEMGVPYARMVRKCLACDFGQGTRDLADEGLRDAFYCDVVCELERLEGAFGRLQPSEDEDARWKVG